MTQNSTIPRSKPTLALALFCGALPGIYLLITSTTYLVDGQFIYDLKRIYQLFVFLAILAVTMSNRDLRQAFAQQVTRVPTWIRAFLGLIILLGLISSIANASSTMHAIYSLLEVALFFLLVVTAMTIAACRMLAGRMFDQVVITFLALTAIAVGFQELIGFAAALANDLEFFARISLMHFSWPRFYNQVQAWTLPVLAALPLIWSHTNTDMLSNRWVRGFVCLFALALYWYVILMTGGRGVALSLLATFVICLLFLPAIRPAFLRWHVPGLLFGVLIFLAIGQINQHVLHSAPVPAASSEWSAPTTVNPQDHYQKEEGETRFGRQSMAGRLSLDSSGRLPMWRDSLRDIQSNPFLGVGPMNFACTGPIYRAGHPHNFALQFAGEWGIPATVFLLAVVGFLVLVLWRLPGSFESRYSSQLTALLITSLVAAGIYSMLSGVFVMPASQVAGVLVGGWLMGIVTSAGPNAQAARRLSNAVILSGVMVCGLVTAFSLSEMREREYRETIISTLDLGIPRYWQQGKLCKYFDEF